MKTKFYAIALFTTVSLAAQGQITITQSDFPGVGTSWAEFIDNRDNVHTITAPGPNQTWDYSAAFLVDDTSGLSFISPSATPAGWATNYPSSTLAVYSAADTSALFYFGNSTGFYADGIYSGSAIALGAILDYNPNQLVVPAPFTYNDTRNNVALITFDQPASPPSPAIRLKLYFISSFVADAWGSLVTPAGTYPSTLRIKQQMYTVDSTFMDLTGTGTYTFLTTSGPSDTTINYNWYRNGANAILMGIEQDAASLQSLGAQYFTIGPVGVPENNSSSTLMAYPNPAITHVNFNLDNNDIATVQVFDVAGKLVRTENVKGINRLTMSTSGFDKGIYFYNCLDGKNNIVSNGKFVVTR